MRIYAANVSLLSTLTGTKEIKMILRAGTAKFIEKLSDVAEKVTGKPARMTSFAVYNLIRNNTFDCSKAKKELCFHTRPFSESMEDTIDWLERENRIIIKRKAS